uniref:U6 small nuclear RNA (adenine-(43)-N(6))-methyltransferase n=1 Tax=Ditylenchus dipsaci TaxID=166011 RepID=A0A915DL66_9BILA
MAFNCFMHERSVFKQSPPDFKELAKKYPNLRENCYIGQNSKVCIDFKNPKAVQALAQAILLEYFGLQVYIPHGSLVPRIPQRLNYILLIEDLVNENALNSGVVGIDVGTGSSCIFPLLAAKTNQWRMYATDADESSITFAKKNVARNSLTEYIEILQSDPQDIFKVVMESPSASSQNFAFSMCNPPFFDPEEGDQRFVVSTSADYFQNDSSQRGRSAPRSTTCAKSNEVFFEGGEVSFVSAMMKESVLYKSRVRIFTTMVGRRSSINPLKKDELKDGCLPGLLMTQLIMAYHDGRGFPKLILPDRVIGLREVYELVSEACKKGNTEYLEALISRPDAIFLDQPYVEVLKYVAALEKDDQQRVFGTLMSKNFSVSSIQPLLEENLAIEEVLTIASLAMDLMCRWCVGGDELFRNALDLCNLLFDCHFQKFVWHNNYCKVISEMNSNLKDMVETCCHFTAVEAASKLCNDIPGLFALPKSDYFMEIVTMESIQL